MPEMNLIPPDLTRCQAESRSFMTLGPGLFRCSNTPRWIAREPNVPHGEMSLCDECKAVCERQVPGVTYRTIPEYEPTYAD